MLVLDTETTTDATQRLLFGSYRFIDRSRCVEEGLFYPDDLSSDQLSILQDYVRTHRADTVKRRPLKFLTLREFLKKFFTASYKDRCLVVGFNLPFDLSRLAFDAGAARRDFRGGFSLDLWTYFDKDTGLETSDNNRPRVVIKHLDSKRALISFRKRMTPDTDDLIPDDSPDGKPLEKYGFAGHFLDLRTLAYALTDRAYSLKAACEAFGVEHSKLDVSDHGTISEEYIDYGRRDVEATAELAVILLREYDLHPISLQETKAFSAASIGKSYLREMGITPVVQRQPNLLPYLGFAQTAFFGGRTSAHIRKVPVPVVYTDFLSMYTTVNSLMSLWQFVIARDIKIVDHCQEEIIQFLQELTEDQLFLRENWPHLTAFVRLVPDGDILPARGQYGSNSNDWQIAINHLYAGVPEDALWFSLPDVVASVLRTGRVPKIVDAFRIEPSRQRLENLKSIRFRGQIEIDPAKQDFFKAVIEERRRVSSRGDLDPVERERISKALKVLANSTNYGIYGQMNQEQATDKKPVTCHGIERSAYVCRVRNWDVPGEFCFPPLAALITGGARLMLALLENCLTQLGGTYAMEDTDSMAIVATERGGLVPCPGGTLKMPDGRPAVNAVSWAQGRQIAKRFESLNPYDRTAVSGSILKIEDCNFDPNSKKQRQIWCFAISAKRYALFLQDKAGRPELLRKGRNDTDNHWSEHGLGHLLNPTDLLSDDREWIAQIWESIIADALGMPMKKIEFGGVPAVGRFAITSPGILAPMAGLNTGKKYPDQIKPFNFLLTCHVNPLGHPVGTQPDHFHLVAPFERNSAKWSEMHWTDQYSGEQFRISMEPNRNDRRTAWVKTFGDVIAEYAYHPESKYADEHGNPSDRQTIGLLQRRHVRIAEIVPIGKESNHLEEVDAGLIHSPDDVYTVYPDQKADHWERIVRPLLNTKGVTLRMLISGTGLSRRMLINARKGHVRQPHPRNQRLIIDALRRLGFQI
jgi:lambda repressor-like predicted transcriptional regulator